MVTGYFHPSYAESLAEFGILRELTQCGGWILQRQIPGFTYYDGMGCYPLFACRDWSQLHLDLEDLEKELISLALVADPFGDYDLSYLHQCFDTVIPYKEHFVVDLHLSVDAILSKHHRRFVRKSLQEVGVEICSNPTQLLDEWVNLYKNLIESHALNGIKAFSKTAFAKQLSIPGTVMFRAVYQGSTIGLHWYYEQGEVIYGHLAALNPICYHLGASYALQWSAIKYFVGKRRWLDLGAGAGVKNDDTGLTFFKRGWSTGTRTAYFCGRIFDRARYSEIVNAKNISTTDYFPVYRKGEFG